jgi:RNA polymerase sigma factor (sigma-70 family)
MYTYSVVNSEHILLAACVNGDRASQEQLYKQFFSFAMGVSLRYLNSKEEAIEVVHDSFIKVFTKAEFFKPESNFKAWFKRILINTSIDALRKEKKHGYLIDISNAEYVNGYDTPASSVLQEQDLMKLVNTLPPAYKTVFCMFAIDGFSHQEIADTLGISEGTSKSNLSRAREILRNKLAKVDKDKIVIKK